MILSRQQSLAQTLNFGLPIIEPIGALFPVSTYGTDLEL
jgi:hypothetical protein